MILSTPSQQSALRACRSFLPSPTRYNPKYQRRRLHHLPQLTHEERFTQDGVGRMLSPAGFDFAWYQYQSYLVERLNKITAGTTQENKETKNILIANARDSSKASLFNHASMAFNNHHFFTTLNSDPPPISDLLTNRINRSFSSVESLRKQFLATANAMFGPGFVWLIRRKNARTLNPANDPELSILCTYLAGSPLPAAHYRKQDVDLNTMDSVQALTRASFMGPYSGSKDSKISPGGADLEVMLGVNTWQHVWLRDWGFGSKMAYLERWWDCIDWDVVEKNGLFENSNKAITGAPKLPRVAPTSRSITGRP